MTAEEFIPKSETGKYSRNQLVQWAEKYHQAKLKLLGIDGVVEQSELLCPICKSSLIYKRVHTDGYSCNNCFHDWV